MFRPVRSLINERTSFVLVNVVVNMAFLLRSYVSMRVLGYQDLGLAALLQTIILLVSALQFGVINGGYRCCAPNRVARSHPEFRFALSGRKGTAAA